MYYGTYLQLEKILDSQHPVSFENTLHEPAHDEFLFIVIHQAYELWFKQILFELAYCESVFTKETINDNSEDLNLVRHRLRRIIKIMQLLNNQIDILDTMTPLDFLEFRNLLTPSSGFQSMQFRLIEAKLGLQMDNRHQKDYYKKTGEGGFTQKDYTDINETETNDSIQVLLNNWLERMPFFNAELWQSYQPTTENKVHEHPFWNDYQAIYAASLTERELPKLADFKTIFFDENNNDLRYNFSAKALRAALFIMLYRDFPLFQTSYQILDSFIEIDHLLSSWRHKHLIMVRRMIGMRVGTGNTSGAGYLEGAMSKHYIYKDLSGLATFLIQRKKMPKLPEGLIRHLSFSNL